MELIADSARFTVKMDRAFIFCADMNFTAVQEIKTLEPCMSAEEGGRKHGEYFELAHIAYDHDIQISVIGKRRWDHFESSALVGLIHDGGTVRFFVENMTAIIEVDCHRAGRIHEDLLQSNHRVSELPETEPVQYVFDRRF